MTLGEVIRAIADNVAKERQDRAWRALENVPCAHTIPGTCDFCRDEKGEER